MRCIPNELTCDGVNDCLDGEDEHSCTECRGDAFLCPGEGKCVGMDDICDGITHCSSGQDEFNCTGCNKNAFHCAADHKCINKTYLCDLIDDCSDGVDETTGCLACAFQDSFCFWRHDHTDYGDWIRKNRYISTGARHDRLPRLPPRTSKRLISANIRLNRQQCLSFTFETNTQTFVYPYTLTVYLRERDDLTLVTQPPYNVTYRQWNSSGMYNETYVSYNETYGSNNETYGSMYNVTNSTYYTNKYFRYKWDSLVLFSKSFGASNSYFSVSIEIPPSDFGQIVFEATKRDESDDEMVVNYINLKHGLCDATCPNVTIPGYPEYPWSIPSSYACNDSGDVRCIPDRFVCDGYHDCAGGGDELNCNECHSGASHCKPSSTCIPGPRTCDGTPDCSDFSDEMFPCVNCNFTSTLCHYQKHAGNGEWDLGYWRGDYVSGSFRRELSLISKSANFQNRSVCLGILFRARGNRFNLYTKSPHGQLLQFTKLSEETHVYHYVSINIHETSPLQIILQFRHTDYYSNRYCEIANVSVTAGPCDAATCPNDTFTCTRPGKVVCIPQDYTCDGYADCDDRSDEMNCTYCKSEATKCKSHDICLAKNATCDLSKDCPDGSDELSSLCVSCDFAFSTCNWQLAEGYWYMGTYKNKRYIRSDDDPAVVRSGKFLSNGSKKCVTFYYYAQNDNFHIRGIHVDLVSGRHTDILSLNASNTYVWEFVMVEYTSSIHNQLILNVTYDGYNYNNVLSFADVDSFDSPCANRCSNTEFTCTKGPCIPIERRCDGFKECDDGSDELSCKKCQVSAYMCNGGSCIPKSSVCNGTYDCPLKDDETNCTSCNGTHLFHCKDRTCVARNLLCNGQSDCTDASDEESCPCTADETRCSGGRCLKKLWVCDGHQDCASGSDEANCSFSCSNNYIRCDGSTDCLPPTSICDGTFDCPYSISDESHCFSLEGEPQNPLSGVLYTHISGSLVPVCYDRFNKSLADEVCQYLDIGSADTLTSVTAPNTTTVAMMSSTYTNSHLQGQFTSASSCPSDLVARVACKTSYRCGVQMTHEQPFQPKIYYGEYATIGAFPWAVSMETSNDRHTCGGTIISEDWILTAAHCVENGVYGYSIHAGFTDINNRGPYYQRRSISQVIIHTDYYSGYDYLNYDMALLKLSSPLSFKDGYVSPVCLPPQGYTFPLASTCYVAGWGRYIPTYSYSSTKLRQGKFNIVPTGECRAVFPVYGGFTGYMCAGYKSRPESCKGDSGSGLVCKSPNNKWYHAGLVSYGTGLCVSYQPTVFMNTTAFTDWIYLKTGL